MTSHINQCRACGSRLQELLGVRSAVREMPQRIPPVELSTALRVIASRERQRAIRRRHWFETATLRFRLWADNLMRPLALPFAGGLVSAMLLFGMLLPSFALRRAVGNDIPVGLFTDPSIKAQMAFEDTDYDADCVLDVLVDNQGRMVDYSPAKGSSMPTNPDLRRAIEKQLLFTEFTPATMFGQPTFGRVRVSFQRRSIDIKS